MEYEKSSEPPTYKPSNKGTGYKLALPTVFFLTVFGLNILFRAVEPESKPQAEYMMEKEDVMRKRQRKLERNKEKVVNYIFSGEAKTDRELRDSEIIQER